MGTPYLRRAVLWLLTSAACAAAAPSVAAAAPRPTSPGRVHTFPARIGGAFGILPPHGSQEIASGTNLPVVYHGGVVMHRVTVHTVFWAPPGYHFDGPPAPGVPGYEQLVQQFFADTAHDSGSTANIFSVLRQYPDGLGPAGYAIDYSAAADSIDDADPYPARHQCASPYSIGTCVTDLQLQQELDKVIAARDPSGRGLHDVWFVLLPPDVDTCMDPGICGSNAYAGYHSLSNLGHGPLIYVAVPDPLIEFTPPPGSDPEGNPEGEATVDTVAHEAVEAITDPEGTGWMDPNGYEVADRCEDAPSIGTPLGYGRDSSPYNQVIGGHEYLIQGMWSNSRHGCVQRDPTVDGSPGLSSVALSQFSSRVTGNIGRRVGGVAVRVELVRAGRVVARAVGRTRASGAWSLRLRGHGFGDDRDAIRVSYGRGGPRADLIRTGDGGDPFTLSGYTGWFDLDNGYTRGPDALLISPCSQVGVLGVRVGRAQTAPPVEQCETETDVAPVRIGAAGPGTDIALSSEDNRAISATNPFGALVTLTVPVGESESVSAATNNQILIEQTGFPSCTAHLEAQSVSCDGLVPGGRYRLFRRRGHAVRFARADLRGALSAALPLRGGDAITLRNHAGRTLTVLHVAHLRVDLVGEQTVVASGSCQPGDWWGPPVSRPPLGPAVDLPGVTGKGRICPLGGSARRLPVSAIEQTDDLGGGQTRTEVPLLEGFAPAADATLYGPFVALARVGLPGPHGSVAPAAATVSLTVTAADSSRRVLFVRNAARPGGSPVRSLAPGAYDARWVVRDRNGDTRTVTSRFVEER